MTYSSLCPRCGYDVPTGETVWLVRGRFYCSEGCARRTYHEEYDR